MVHNLVDGHSHIIAKLHPQPDIELLSRAFIMQGTQLEKNYTDISEAITDIEVHANKLSSTLGRNEEPARFSTLWGDG